MANDPLERLALELEAIGIPYLVIGGQAVLVYGEPRFTKDIDITLGVGPERLGEILELAGRLNCEVKVQPAKEFVDRTLVLPCHDPLSGMDIDFLFSWSPYERQAMTRARLIPLGKAQVRFASLEDLFIHKMVAGRPRDLEDLRKVLLKNPRFDREYVDLWLKDFEHALGQPFTGRFEEILKSLPKA